MKSTHHIYALRKLRDRAIAEGDTRDMTALDAAITVLDAEQAAEKLAQSVKRVAMPAARPRFKPGSYPLRANLPI